MNRREIVVPRASWCDVFSDEREKALIPGIRRLLGSQMGPAAMHLTGSPLLSKEWGEVHNALFVLPRAIRSPEVPELEVLDLCPSAGGLESVFNALDRPQFSRSLMPVWSAAWMIALMCGAASCISRNSSSSLKTHVLLNASSLEK
jgi:hypothetical protein